MVATSSKESGAGQPAKAGMQNGRQRKKIKPLLEPVSESGEHGNSKFARALGSGDFLTRERGVQSLTRFLQLKTDISESDMLKLWHGLYFCFWHSDTPPVQADLASRLSGVLPSLNKQVAQLYFTVFIQTMQREWQSIHYLRLDKFLMLVRKFLGQALSHLAQHGWEDSHVATYMQFLQDHVLVPRGGVQRSAGLTYHMCDIYLSELKRTLLATNQAALASATLQALLQPFITAVQKTDDQTLVKRIKEGMFDALLEEVQADDDDDDEAGAGAADKLPRLLVSLTPNALAEQLLELGEGVVMRERNRAVLYGVSQALEKAARKRAKRDTVAATKPNLASKAAATPQANGKSGGKGGHGKSNGSTPAVKSQPQQQEVQPDAAVQPALASSAKKRKQRSTDVLDGSEDGVLGSQIQQLSQHVDASKVKPAKSALKASKPAANGVPPSPAPKAVTNGVAVVAQSTGGKAKAGAAQANGAAKEPHVRWVDGDGQPAGAGQAAAGAAGAKTPHTGKGKAVAAAEDAGAASAKKSVRINLRKNLYFDFGGPVPDPLVRTPPASRSKGGILKTHTAQTSQRLRSKAHAAAAAGSQSAPPKVVTLKVPSKSTPQQPQIHTTTTGARQNRRPVTPNSVKRARAGDLFS